MNNTARIRPAALANFLSVSPCPTAAGHWRIEDQVRAAFPEGVCLLYVEEDGSISAGSRETDTLFRRLPRTVFAFGTDFDAALPVALA